MVLLTSEAKAREHIDNMLKDAGWHVQNMENMNLMESEGVAVCEFPTTTGPVDYMLFVDGKAIGVVEAKAEGTTLGAVTEQSQRYMESLPPHVKRWSEPLSFGYESTGIETFFRDTRDPDYRSRRVFSFHKPKTLKAWIQQEDTLRARLKILPPLDIDGLRDCQVEAIEGLERSFARNDPKALVQATMGSGKTFTAISACYRLIKYAKAKRILFLVDRKNLGKQAYKEFQQFITPDSSRKFTELYNVQFLQGTYDPVCKVVISTIQRAYSMLRGEPFEEGSDDFSMYDTVLVDVRPKEVAYNRDIPIEDFDFIIIDECHRSIYNLWSQVLEYFDAFLIGLTATPSKQTLGFFDQNLVSEYSHERAVVDGVNVGYEIYRIKTNISENGSKVDKGLVVDKRNTKTRQLRWEQLDEDLEYQNNELDRTVVAKDQIRTIFKTFRDVLFTELFPGRVMVPKTLVFAKNDAHAEDIVEIIKEVFGKGNEFVKKITYRAGEDTDNLIAALRTSTNPRIAVTVDMISTGTDVKPLECLIFMRDVKSAVYYEQMKGRGTRVIDPTDLRSVTSDAIAKTHFVLLDAVGVTESDKDQSRPLERSPGISFEKLLKRVAQGDRSPDTLSSLAGRFSRLERKFTEEEQQEVIEVTGGLSLGDMAGALLDAIEPETQIKKAKEIFETENPGEEQISEAAEILADEAVKPFNSPQVREILVNLKTRSEQTIDITSKDDVIYSGFDTEKARGMIRNFKEFINDNKDELDALQILFNQPYGKRHLTFKEIRDLAHKMARPPYNIAPDYVWRAYEHLDKSRVKPLRPEKLLTNIISLIRFATGQADILEPFPDVVEKRFETWLAQQKSNGHNFTAQQTQWLSMIKDHIAASSNFELDDFENVPFNQHGGIYKASEIFGAELTTIIEEMNEVLTA